MRRRFIQDPKTFEFIEVPLHYVPPQEFAYIQPDLPDYESPIDGRVISGRRQRRNDLARSSCRPYEGREQEAKEAAKVHAERDRKLDAMSTEMAHRAWAEAPERIRKHFRYRD
jgi:hypothetical protein